MAVQFLTLSAIAADKLDVDLMPSALRVRSESPIPAQVRFKWNGTYILEGRFEVELREANRILGRYRSGDLALTTGDQTFHVLLPPCLEPFSDSQVEAHMKFVTAKQELDLGYSILFMPVMNERSFVLGWCNAHSGGDQPSTAQQELMFERLAPPDSNDARRLLNTSIVRMTPEDLPAQPLAYTSFDVMVLNAEAFKEAHEGQLRALARWVKGGGSVCVFVNGGLKPYHVEFLNDLAEASVIDPAFTAGADGNLLASQKKISNLFSGLGRSVIILGNTTADAAVSPSTWREAVAFLWKFRAAQIQAISATGHWVPNDVPSQDPQVQMQQYQQATARRWRPPQINYTGLPTYSPQPSQLTTGLTAQLLPRTVRLIPFPALVATLGLFLLLIGPADYFVLGFLKRRKYTWVLFPALSIAFMVATVLMANYFLGQRDQRRSLVVVDLDKDGTALRWNRYELIFAARDKLAVTEVKDALWAPLSSNPMMESYPGGPINNYNYNPQMGYRAPRYRSTATRDFGPPWYEGSLPVHFRTSQSINQWEPKLNRTFSFEPPPVPMLTNWSEVEKAWPDLDAIRKKLSEKKPFTGDLCTISGNGMLKFDAGFENPADANAAPAPREFRFTPGNGMSYQVTFTGATNRVVFGFPTLTDLCFSSPTGLQSLVSQLSPTGGGNFEDEPDMDSGDSALLVTTQIGDDIVVYRRVFHGK